MLVVRIALLRFSLPAKREAKNSDVQHAHEVLSRSVAILLYDLWPDSIQESDLLEVVRSKKEVGDDASTSSLLEVSFRRNDFRSSTKLEALMQNLRVFLHVYT
jgi:hypothetical protein